MTPNKQNGIILAGFSPLHSLLAVLVRNTRGALIELVVCSDPGPLTPAFVTRGSWGRSSKAFHLQ